jgi:hypothetical protein
VYGPVCTVVWQGSAVHRRPYADQTAFGEASQDYSRQVAIAQASLTRLADNQNDLGTEVHVDRSSFSVVDTDSHGSIMVQSRSANCAAKVSRNFGYAHKRL